LGGNRSIYFTLTLLTYLLIVSVNFTLISTIVIEKTLHEPMLPLCGSHIDKLYCDNWSVVKLSCVPTTVNNVLGYVVIVSEIIQALFTLYSYYCIVRVCLKSKEGKRKFMQTCLPHLMAMVNFVIAALFDSMYNRYGSASIPLSLRNIMAVQFLVIPPLFNPVIYGLNLQKFKSDNMDNTSGEIIFTLSGLNTTRTNKQIYFAFVLLTYLFTLFVNLTLIVTILLEKVLHEPMYIFLCNLCVNGICGATGFYPKFLEDLLSDSQMISYSMCKMQMIISFLLIIISYVRIIRSCLQSQARQSKFMETCLPHMIALFNFILSSFFDSMYARYGPSKSLQDLRNILSVEFLIVPPLLNPLIYGLKLKQIRS
ncbi:olfactory receptor 52E8-like, partial [Scleropages formosus]